MALEKIHGTQIVTWAPPLPQRAFQILSAGQTTDNMFIGGMSTDGKRYGYFVLNTIQWMIQEGFHDPPVRPGEQFQIYQVNTAGGWSQWISPPVFGDGDALPDVSNPNRTSPNAPDLFAVYTLTQTRELEGATAPYILADPTVHTIAAVQQSSSGAWFVYFSPNTTISISPQNMGIVTIPRPYNPKYLGQIGHVSGTNYTYSIPGGPDQLTCLLQIEPDYRTDAMNPGRIVTAHRGCSCIWYGQLTEPQPAATGWTLTANGVGTFGTNFGAWWQPEANSSNKKSPAWNPDAPIDFAIDRGLPWVNRGIGRPPGIYTGPQQDPGSMTITDFLNLLCTGGSLTWELVQPASASSWPPGPWELKIYDLPTDQNGNPLAAGPPVKIQIPVGNNTKWVRIDLLQSRPRRPPDLFLVNTSPVARTIQADYNTIIIRYQATPDITATSTKKAQAATFNTIFVDQPGSVALHGRMEYFLDITNAGSMTQDSAAQIGKNVLSKYIRANFAGSFPVMPGQLLNTGGVPVDLGLNWAGAVCTLQVKNEAFGGEVGNAPITFMIGQYEYDDDTQTATVTPYQNAKTDIASVIASLYPGKFA